MENWPSGIFTTEQAVGRFGRARVRRWVQSGAWIRPFRGIYVSADIGCDDETTVRLAAAAYGQELVAVRESAAILNGFGVLPARPVHLAGDATKTARSQPGVRIHGFKLPPDDIREQSGIQSTTADRTVVDIARMLDPIDALPYVDAALRSGVCSADSLAVQLARQSGARGIVAARQLIAWGDGAAESPMESRTRLRVLDSQLPAPCLQWWVRDGLGRPIYRLDLAWPEFRVGLEYDGSDHVSRVRQRSDIERRSWLAQANWHVLWVTDVDVYRRYTRMIARVRRLIDRGSGDHAERADFYGVSSTLSA